VILLALCASPTLAAWGPFGGGAILNVKDPGIGRFTGWEAGLTLADPDSRGFWQFAGGRATSRVDSAELTSAQARLNFRAGGTRSTMLYVGTGVAMDWIDQVTTTRRVWVFSTQAGVLVAPDRLLDVFKNKTTLDQQWMATSHALPSEGVLTSHILLGVEAGYHTAKLSLSGLETRAFLTITY
jgi:hypothetical protein